jgi:hypothetical protein
MALPSDTARHTSVGEQAAHRHRPGGRTSRGRGLSLCSARPAFPWLHFATGTVAAVPIASCTAGRGGKGATKRQAASVNHRTSRVRNAVMAAAAHFRWGRVGSGREKTLGALGAGEGQRERTQDVVTCQNSGGICACDEWVSGDWGGTLRLDSGCGLVWSPVRTRGVRVVR